MFYNLFQQENLEPFFNWETHLSTHKGAYKALWRNGQNGSAEGPARDSYTGLSQRPLWRNFSREIFYSPDPPGLGSPHHEFFEAPTHK